ncbi:hypothetical protein [Chimaeribacter arupi]|uniref:hypothetical protein n=1 Tax=Chimaeribacter arupi TaxID=2060066 RepID=UPI0011AF30C3|nr:hypothetical protein [Chimaeribacter arupi]
MCVIKAGRQNYHIEYVGGSYNALPVNDIGKTIIGLSIEQLAKILADYTGGDHDSILKQLKACFP